MSYPVGHASDPTGEDSPLNHSSPSSEFADSLPHTFVAWLADLKPVLDHDKSFARPSDPPQPLDEIRFEGTLRVDCYLTGRLRSLTGTLLISETGEVESDIVVAAAVIDGILHGDIQASERVELQSHAKVFGNIDSPVLVIQPGAVFEGQSRFVSTPLESASRDSEGEETVAVKQPFTVEAAPG